LLAVTMVNALLRVVDLCRSRGAGAGHHGCDEDATALAEEYS
jgi:hypothetical protein